MSLHQSLAHYHARRVHVSDIPEAAVRALHWLRYERQHRDENAELRRMPSEYGDLIDYNEREIEYARERWTAEWARARQLRDTIPSVPTMEQRFNDNMEAADAR